MNTSRFIQDRMRQLAHKWLRDTGIGDATYQNIAPYDAAKRNCAMELIAILDYELPKEHP